jgi:TonB family protein
MQKPNRLSHGWIRDIAALMLFIFAGVVGVGAHNQQPPQTVDEHKGAAEWLKFSPQNAPFSLLLPASPVEKSKDEEPGITVHNYKLTVGPIEYQVLWLANVPDTMLVLDALFSRGLQGILDSARQAGHRYLTATRQKDITLDGCLGRESSLESETANIEAKGFIAGHGFVTLAVLYPKEASSSADARRFLESLSLPEGVGVDLTRGNDTRAVETGTSLPAQVDTRPMPLNRPRPEYTEQARRHGIQGAIRTRALVGADGLVKDVRLATHLPDGLDEQATKAVRQLRFKPATMGGRAVSAWVIIEVEFHLRKKQY